jgi:hypothetical protein
MVCGVWYFGRWNRFRREASPNGDRFLVFPSVRINDGAQTCDVGKGNVFALDTDQARGRKRRQSTAHGFEFQAEIAANLRAGGAQNERRT